MDNSAFMLTLTSEDWDRNLGGWRCPALRIPGANIESIFESGNKIDSSWYEVLINQQIIRWSRAELPEKIAVSITLTKELSTYEITARWKKAAIIVPILTTLLSSIITASVTLYISQTKLEKIPPSPPPSKICRITNPLQTDGEIRWDKTELKIEGYAENISDVWIVIENVNENQSDRASLIKSKVNDTLWDEIIRLDAPISAIERRYRVSIFSDTIGNNKYFNEMLSKRVENQELFYFPEGEPNERCHSIIIKRITS